MKFSEEKGSNDYIITSYTSDSIVINQKPYTKSLIITPNQLIPDWDVQDIDQLGEPSLREILSLDPEIIILGTGSQHHFLTPTQMRILVKANVGFEVMPTSAAIRTYTILASEDRQVVAGLILD